MIIEFFGPFQKIAEKETRIEVEAPITLAELLERLQYQYPKLKPLLMKETYAELSAHVMFIKNGEPIKLNDVLIDEDIIQVLLPVTGG